MPSMVELWGLRWVEYPKGLICLDAVTLSARLIHLDDWQFTFKDQAPTVGKTPEEALEASLGPPIQVLGVTYYPMPPEDSCKQYLPEPRGRALHWYSLLRNSYGWSKAIG